MATVVFCENITDTVVQVSCTMASLGCMRFVPFVQFYVFPPAAPSGIHKTALRVQIPYTLASHGTTITYTVSKDASFCYNSNVVTLWSVVVVQAASLCVSTSRQLMSISCLDN